MTVPVFKFALREDIKNDVRFLPTKGEPLATGYDVRACFKDKNNLILRAGEYFKIPLGFRSFCPDGWYYQLHPRSSSFAKKYMQNLIGVIDESWEGETLLAGQYIPDINSMGKDIIIKYGDAIAQIIPCKREEMVIVNIDNSSYNELCLDRNSLRGAGGFGSTDKK